MDESQDTIVSSQQESDTPGEESVGSKKSSSMFLLLVLFVVVIIVSIGAFFILRSQPQDNSVNNSQANVPTSANATDSNDGVVLPEYKSAGSKEALGQIIAKANEWSSDVKFLSCGAMVYPYDKDGNRYYIGGNDGAFPAWSCMVYSPSKKQDTAIEWRKGTVEVKEPHTTWGGLDASKYEQDPNARDFYNPTDFMDTVELVSVLESAGVDFSTNYVTYSFGHYGAFEQYGDDAVWQVDVYSRSEKEDPNDEYSQGKKLKMIFIDGATGELLQ